MIILGTYFGRMPLILHGLRYYCRCGPGAVARADEIESAQSSWRRTPTALDEDEELLIEERAGKRIAARRIVAAHFADRVHIWLLLLLRSGSG